MADEGWTEIEVVSGCDSMDGSLIFHVVYDVSAFLLYMHQQIPSLLQDMTLEFDSLQTEYKELEIVLNQGELNASSKRKHTGRKREVKLEIRRVEKLMSTISAFRTALQLTISEVSTIENVVLVLGASPRRPQCACEMRFASGRKVPKKFEDITRSRMVEQISRKVIRALVSKGVGSVSYTGPSKLFLLVKAPASFNMPMHFFPKRDFSYNKKVIPSRLQFKLRTNCHSMDSSHCASKTTCFDAMDTASDDLIWFQCRHVIKGLAYKNPSPQE